MINRINKIIEDQFDVIRTKTMFDILRCYLIISTTTFVSATFFSVYNVNYKLRIIVSFLIIVCIISLVLFLIWKKITKEKTKMGLFFMINLIFTIYASFSFPDKYLTTTGIGLVVLTVVIFANLSLRLLLIQGTITITMIIVYGILGIGKSVNIGSGYVFANSGMYILMIYTLYKCIRMFNQFRDINREQLVILNQNNEEICALNEEYIATDEILRHNLEYDALTGLLNRDGFHKQVEPLFQNNLENRFNLFLFDVDDFMFINNAFGFIVGDKVLVQIADRLRENSPFIEYISRGEGDSFMFISQTGHGIEKVLHILDVTFQSIYVDGVNLRIRASIGIAQSDQCTNTVELLRNAEAAMRQIKQTGKGAFITYNNVFVRKMEEQFTIFNSIDDAIVNNEFYNLYQPKVDIKSRKIIGFEALVRWKSRKYGIIYPDKFISTAEHTGQIIDIGYVVMKNAMKFSKIASGSNPDILISINISPKQLLEKDFIEQVKTGLHESKADAKNIAFEITETAYVEHLDVVNTILNEINQLGILIYLDDFGTGYSSLNYLNKLPIQVLKIDRSFIEQIHQENQAVDLVRTILVLAKSLKIKCIAEGVELKEQLSVLEANDCDYIQGYIFDKPLSEYEAISKIDIIFKD